MIVCKSGLSSARALAKSSGSKAMTQARLMPRIIGDQSHDLTTSTRPNQPGSPIFKKELQRCNSRRQCLTDSGYVPAFCPGQKQQAWCCCQEEYER